MRVKYIGESFGVDGLTDGKTYEVQEVDSLTGMLRVVDDSGEDYLYSPTNPGPITSNRAFGKFEIVEDDETGTLRKLIA
ncbi:MAG: hypothetical protein K5663_11345 [Clostridiales bacterium]|nr:hypothetical protein [Clostridiales bacterium]